MVVGGQSELGHFGLCPLNQEVFEGFLFLRRHPPEGADQQFLIRAELASEQALELIVQRRLDVLHPGIAGDAAEGLLQPREGALGRLLAVAEAYPDLKASDNMRQFQEELTSTENRVAFARQAFNDGVMEYNTYKQSFPQNFFAGPPIM